MRAVPAALAYLQDWRSVDGLTAPEFNRIGLRRAVDELSAAWSVDAPYHEECLGSMGMVRYPRTSTYLRTYRASPSAPTPSDRGCATATASRPRLAVSRMEASSASRTRYIRRTTI